MKKALVVLLFFCFSKAFSQTKNTYIYTNQDVKIELKTGNEKGVLKINELNPISIVVENLDSRTMSCIGPGLSILKGASAENPESLWQINLINTEKKSVYKFIFSYKKNNKHFSGTFEIPIE
jgi:hypothetical protein